MADDKFDLSNIGFHKKNNIEPAVQIKQIFENYQKYCNTQELDKFLNLHDSSYRSADGYNIDSLKELAKESLDTILADMPLKDGDEVCVLINGLGATSQEELYILSGDVSEYLKAKGIKIHRTFVGEYATSMEMAGASISICKITDEEMRSQIDKPVYTPFYCQK